MTKFPADTTVGVVKLINVPVSGEPGETVYVTVRAVLSVDQGPNVAGRPRFEWSLTALGIPEMRIGADSQEDLGRSCAYMVTHHINQCGAVILMGEESGYTVRLFNGLHHVNVAPGIEAKPEEVNND